LKKKVLLANIFLMKVSVLSFIFPMYHKHFMAKKLALTGMIHLTRITLQKEIGVERASLVNFYFNEIWHSLHFFYIPQTSQINISWPKTLP
jgi:hypothetical protein